MKKSLQLLHWLLAATLLLAVSPLGVTAAVPNKLADPPGLEWQKNKKPVTLDLFINYTWFGLNWTDPTAARVTKRTGVTVNIMKPVADDNQKLNIMIAGNSLPDMVILGKDNPALPMMIKAGSVYAMDDLIAKYAPKFKSILRKEMLRNYKSDDGKTYYLPDFVEGEDFRKMALENNGLISMNQSVWSVRKDYYDEIGRPDMSTPEKFNQALAKMAAKHPDKIPFYPADEALSSRMLDQQQNLRNIGNQFGVGDQYYVTGKEIKWAVRDPKFLDTLKFLHNLQTQNLLTKDPFIDSKDVQTAKVNNGDPIVYTWTIGDGEKIPADNKNSHYEILKPFPTYRQFRLGDGWNAVLISKKAKDPARCIRFLEYCYSVQGHKDLSWGLEGDSFRGDVVKGPHYKLVDGLPVHLPAYLKLKTADWPGVASKNGLGEYWFCNDSVLWNLPFWNKNDKRLTEFNREFGKYVEYHPELSGINPVAGDDETIIRQKVIDIMKDSVAKIVFAKDENSAVAEYHNFISKCEAAGLVKLEKYWTAKYQAKMKSMGLK